jgi:hypothetical protein
MATRSKTLIGWREWCELPDLGLPAISAKVDTGARTSALHAFDIEPFTRHRKHFVRFKVHPVAKNKHMTVQCEAPLVEKRTIRSSNGARQVRPVILTDIRIGDKVFTTELTLTSRHNMNFRMLLGRKALRSGRFAIDPVKSFLFGKIEDVENLYKNICVET